jgi:hypothetical protein
MIDVDMFSKHLYTRYYPDLLIRTSREMRLSNFLLWQLSYTEMYVTPKLWPDFTRKSSLTPSKDFGNETAGTERYKLPDAGVEDLFDLQERIRSRLSVTTDLAVGSLDTSRRQGRP